MENLWVCKGVDKGSKRGKAAAGVIGVWRKERAIYVDKQSGKGFNRPKYQ